MVDFAVSSWRQVSSAVYFHLDLAIANINYIALVIKLRYRMKVLLIRLVVLPWSLVATVNTKEILLRDKTILAPKMLLGPHTGAWHIPAG